MSGPVSAQTSVAQARSLYRRLLRELPARSPSNLANPSPIQTFLRAEFSSKQGQNPSQSQQQHPKRPMPAAGLAQVAEFTRYLAAQRTYTVLLERYNPGMNMTEEERVRLSARRVGMDLPVDGRNR